MKQWVWMLLLLMGVVGIGIVGQLYMANDRTSSFLKEQVRLVLNHCLTLNLCMQIKNDLPSYEILTTPFATITVHRFNNRSQSHTPAPAFVGAVLETSLIVPAVHKSESSRSDLQRTVSGLA